MGPLEGIKVLDFSRIVAGPYCSMLLGDLGAEIIKVEQPGVGDDLRVSVRYEGRGEKDEDYFYPINRNKKSITLNLKHPKGREIALELVKQVDVVLENFSPGVMERLGLNYEVVKEYNPQVIYCSISGFGQTGPDRNRRAYDGVIQATSGIMSVTGEKDRPPVRVGILIGDMSSAVYAAFAIVSALLYRNRTGEGQMIDISMVDCLVSMAAPTFAQYLANGKIPERVGSENPNRVPSAVYRTKNGVYILITASEETWRKICSVLGMEEYVDDPRFAKNKDRVNNREELNRIMQEKLLAKDGEDWYQELLKEGVPCALVNTADKVFSDPHILARDMLWTLEHPVSGKIKVVGSPLKFSKMTVTRKDPPPLLGQHTEEILGSYLGLSHEVIEGLRKEGVV